MSRGSRAVLAILVSVALSAAPLRARAGTLTGGATEWTQISNNVQLIQHSVHLIQSVWALKKQVEYWWQASQQARSPEDAFRIFQGFTAILNRMQFLLFNSESIVERWKQAHPGRKDPTELGYTSTEVYREIDESTRKAVSRSMEALELQANSADGWPTDRTIYQNLQAKMQTVTGQLQAAMVANELLLEVIRQLHLLRQVQIAHAEMMGYHVSAESQRRQYDDTIRNKRLEYTGEFRHQESDTNSVFGADEFTASSTRAPAPGSTGGDENWQPAKGPRAPAPGSTGGDENWQPGSGPRAPAPGSTGGDEHWQPGNGPRAPAPGSTSGDENWQPGSGPRAPAPGSTGGDENWRPAKGPRAPAPSVGGVWVWGTPSSGTTSTTDRKRKGRP